LNRTIVLVHVLYNAHKVISTTNGKETIKS